MVNPLDLIGNVLVMHTCQFHMCYLYLWSMCLLCMHGGGHVTILNLMVILLDVFILSVCQLCICCAD